MADEKPPEKSQKPGKKPKKPLRKKFERKLAAQVNEKTGEMLSVGPVTSRARAAWENAPSKDSPIADKVEHITHLMVTGEWRGYATRAQLCEVWSCADETCRRYAAEAHRRLELDEELLQQERVAHAVFCARIQREALATYNVVTGMPDFTAALKATELAAKFRGIELDNRKVELTGRGGGPIALSLEDLETAIAAGEANVADDPDKSEPVSTEADPIHRG